MSSSKQALIYSFVAKGSVVLAEHTAFTGNFSTVAVQCLQKLPPDSTRSTYSCDGHTFNFLVHRDFVFLVVADEAAARSVPFVFLERVKDDFMQRYSPLIDKQSQHPLADDEDDFLLEEDPFSVAYHLDREFGPRLKDHMQYCVNHPEEINKIAKVKAHLSEVKGIMMDNIEKILDRGEKIELLVGKTETLQSQVQNGKAEDPYRYLKLEHYFNSVHEVLVHVLPATTNETRRMHLLEQLQQYYPPNAKMGAAPIWSVTKCAARKTEINFFPFVSLKSMLTDGHVLAII